MHKARSQPRRELRRTRPLVLLVGAIAAITLSLAPSAARSDPTGDRIAAAVNRVPVRPLPPGLGGQAGVRRGMPAFACQMLDLRMPSAVRGFLQSMGVGPCASE